MVHHRNPNIIPHNKEGTSNTSNYNHSCTEHNGHTNNAHNPKFIMYKHATKNNNSCHSTPASNYLSAFKRTTVALILLLLVSYIPIFPAALITVLKLTIVSFIVWFGRIFFKHAWHEIKTKQFGMMTLVSMGIAAGYIFLVANTLMNLDTSTNFTLEISSLIWILLLGHYIEARTMYNAQDLLDKIAKLLPKQAHIIKNYTVQNSDLTTVDVNIYELKVGDIVLVKSGEKIPADGTIIKGNAYINEALITGESKPQPKKTGNKVYAGSICEDGGLIIKVTKVGDESTVGQIKRLTEQAMRTKPNLQRLGDKIAKYLTLFALVTAIVSIIIWTVFLGKPLSFSVPLAITVLVIACPHALGIAIPLVNSIAIKIASTLGIFIKDLSKLETISTANYIVFDKTGTITTGRPVVTKVLVLDNNFSELDVLSYIASLEQFANHPVAKAALKYAKNKGAALFKVDNYKYHPGKGVEGKINNTTYYAGSLNFAKEFTNIYKNYLKHLNEISREGSTVIILFSESKIIGAILLEDTIRPSAKTTIKEFKKLKLTPVLLTGDNKEVAIKVSKQLGIKDVFASVKPEEKYKYIKNLQLANNKVIMVGDGINDAAALTQADVGIAIGEGADVALEAGDIVLVNSNLQNLINLLKLAKATYKKMIENVIWAIIYNVLAIPVAAGILFPIGVKLTPQIGALAMTVSDIVVSINALLLNKIKNKLENKL